MRKCFTNIEPHLNSDSFKGKWMTVLKGNENRTQYSNTIKITTENIFIVNAHKDIFTLSNWDIKLSTLNLVTNVITNSTKFKI